LKSTLKTAKPLGPTISETLLATADEVIQYRSKRYRAGRVGTQ
jgi:hypothetical protein